MPSQTRRKSLWEAVIDVVGHTPAPPFRASLSERLEQVMRHQRPSAVGVLPADWEYVTRIAPGMGEDPLMRLIKLGIGSPNTSDWR